MALQAGLVLDFGITNASQTYGLLQSWSDNPTVKRATAKSPSGGVISIQEYDEQSFLDLTYIPLDAGSTDSPVIGTPFTLDGTTWRVDSIENIKEVSGFANVNILATYYGQLE